MCRMKALVLVLVVITTCSLMVYVMSIGYIQDARSTVTYHLSDKEISSTFSMLLRPSAKISNSEHKMATKSKMAARQAGRRQRVKEVCSYLMLEHNTSTLPYPALDHIIVDDHHRLIYCYVPKVACTNWKRIMLILTNQSLQSPLDIPANDSHRQKVFRTLDTYTPEEVDLKLRSYLKFLFVRHPFERVLSAYRNKFQQNYSTYFQQRFGRQIIKRFRTNPSAESLEKGNDVTFKEFVQYLTNEETQKETLNEHWRSVFQLCHPCRINYDIVGKYETLQSDAQHVLESAEVDQLVAFPVLNKTSNTADLIKDYFANISRHQTFRLFQLYSLDFKMFDYHYHLFDKYLPN